jgi:hypothetical protein
MWCFGTQRAASLTVYPGSTLKWGPFNRRGSQDYQDCPIYSKNDAYRKQGQFSSAYTKVLLPSTTKLQSAPNVPSCPLSDATPSREGQGSIIAGCLALDNPAWGSRHRMILHTTEGSRSSSVNTTTKNTAFLSVVARINVRAFCSVTKALRPKHNS